MTLRLTDNFEGNIRIKGKTRAEVARSSRFDDDNYQSLLAK
jgi:hypothetical protein